MRDRVTIIAEAAQGFEGSVTIAKLLVRAAAAAGTDAVKFQLVYADELATPSYRYYDLYKQLEMTDQEWTSVAEEARTRGIQLILDVFGEQSLRLAVSLGAAVKLHGSDFFNGALLREAYSTARSLFISIGGIRKEEITALVESIPDAVRERVTILYGYQAEPTGVGDNNVARLLTLFQHFPDMRFGFMDHAAGDSDESSWLGVLAVASGATVVEKHITLERSLEMEDCVSALSPSEMKRYVGRIRAAESAMGSSSLELTEAELAYRQRSLKVVVATDGIAAGETVSASAVTLRRTQTAGTTDVLVKLTDAVGRKTVSTVEAGAPVRETDLVRR